MRALASIALTLAAGSASAGWFGNDCDNTAARSASAPLAGATRIVIIGRAGTLRVTCARGATEVRATGTACSSDRDDLSKITLTATRSGSELRVEPNLPQSVYWGRNSLDFAV